MKEIHTIIKKEHKLEGQRLLEDPMTQDEVVFLGRILPLALKKILSGEMGRIIDYTGNYLLISLSESEKERMKRIIAERNPKELEKVA